MGRIKNHFFAHQRDVILSPKLYTIIHGGVGSGKTRACLWSLFLRAQRIPNQTFLLGALTQRHIYDIGLRTWLHIFPPYSFSYNHGMQAIHVYNPFGEGFSIILLRGLENDASLARIRGITLTGYCLMQAELLSESVFYELEQRIRGIDNAYYHFRIFDANTGPRSHWLYRYFIDSYGPKFYGEELVKSIHVRSTDNPDAFQPYQLALARKTLGETRYQRVFEGVWGSEENLVYPSPRILAEVPSYSTFSSFWVGIDPGAGNTHPCALVWVGMVERDDPSMAARYIVIEEKLLRNYDLQDLPEIIDEVNHKLGIRGFGYGVIDWSGLIVRRFLERGGIPVFFPSSDSKWRRVSGGCHLVEAGFRLGVLSISPNCSHILHDMREYAWAKEGGSPDKSRYDSHVLDALRYVWIRIGRHTVLGGANTMENLFH